MLSYSDCRLCPRQCGADRIRGELGFCRMPAGVRAARAAPHYWEEPPVSGSFGSGAVFFSGCTLRCRFCQNADISAGGFGKPLTAAELRACFERLVDEGCQNLNLVTATHFLPTVVEALTPKLPVPVVYNCGGYERVETLRELAWTDLDRAMLFAFQLSVDILVARGKAVDEHSLQALEFMKQQLGI